jgi:glycogen synthase
LSGKRRIKSKLRQEYGLLDSNDLPLIGMTTRFVEQNFSWKKSAEKYLTVYNQLLSKNG